MRCAGEAAPKASESDSALAGDSGSHSASCSIRAIDGMHIMLTRFPDVLSRVLNTAVHNIAFVRGLASAGDHDNRGSVSAVLGQVADGTWRESCSHLLPSLAAAAHAGAGDVAQRPRSAERRKQSSAPADAAVCAASCAAIERKLMQAVAIGVVHSGNAPS